MSWLGNSLNSITGHLSNFTKEVLIEGREEVSDHGAELSIARTRVRELEIQCNAQRHELDRLRLGNRELEERCQASDLQLASLTSQYRELQRSKQQETVQSNGDLSTGDQNINGRNDAQNEEFFRQLQDAAEQHHQQMSALQDHHDERLSQLQNSYQQRLQTLERQLRLFQGEQNERGTPSDEDQTLLRRLSELESELTNVRQRADETESQLRNKEKQISLLNRQLEKLQTEKLRKSPKIQRHGEEAKSKEHELNDLTDSTSQTENTDEIEELNKELVTQIKTLEEQLLLKDEEICDLSSEKQNLDSSLVELDGQHQEEIDAVLAVKEELSATNKIISLNLEEAKNKNECLEKEIASMKNQLANLRVKSDENDQVAHSRTILNQLDELNVKNQRLEEKLKQSDDEIKRLGQESINQEGNYLREKEQLEKELSDVKVRAKELESIVLEKDDGGATNTTEFITGNTNANTMIQQMSSENENLQNEADDLRTKLRANAREIDMLKLEIDSLKVETGNLREQLERRNAVVEGLEDSLEQTEKSHAKQIAENEEQVLGLKEKLDILEKEDPQVKITPVTEINSNSSQTDKQTEISSSQTDSVTVANIENNDTTKEQELLIHSLREELLKIQETSLLNCKDKDDEIVGLRAQLNDFIQKVEESSKLKSNLLKEVSESEEKNSIISNLEEEIQSCQEKLRVLQHSDLKEAEWENNKAILSEELEKFKERANRSEKYAEELSSELVTLRSQIDESTSLKEKQDWDQPEKNFHNMNNTLHQKDSEIKFLTKQIESLLSSQKSSVDSTPTDGVDKDCIDRIKLLESEKERLLTVLNEKSRECSGLKAEVHRLFGVISAEKQALLKLQQDNLELSHQKLDETEKEMTKEAVHNLARIIKDKDLEIESLKQKSETLLAVMHQTHPGHNDNVHLEKLMSEKDELMKQVQAYQNDREQITTLLNQKHQESLAYHAEMQKLNSQLMIEKENYHSLKEQHQSVSRLFEEKQKSLINTQNEVVSLKQRVTELERSHTDLSSKYSSIVDKTSETIQINRDEFIAKQQILEELQSKIRQCDELIIEKDRMIYQLNHSLEETSVILFRKEETLKTLQHRLDDISFKFSETEMKLKETAEEGASSSDDLQRLRMENEALHEETKSLTMSLKQSQFEKESMKEKIATLIQLVQEKDTKNNESSENGQSASSAQLLHDFALLEEKMGVTTLERDQTLLALSQQQQENKNQQREQKKFQEQNEKLHSELDRLRNHLLEIQDNYTQEIMAAEDREKALRIKLASAEDRASLSTNAIANASLESQNRVDSLQQQLSQVMRQRDSALEQCSRLEDQIQQLKAAITNLQSALECIQGEQRRELIEASKASQEKIRLKEKDIDILKSRVSEREARLKETMEALDAASRLSEQLDRKEQLINELRKEVSEKQRILQKSLDEIKELESHTEGKVDKQIMKSLVLGYLSAPVHQKPEVIRLLARILDFNQIEMEKAGLKIGREKTPSRLLTPNRGGWISNIIGKVVPTPPPSENRPISRPSSPSISNPGQSFSTLFVEFLKNESQPNIPARMPLESMASGSSASNTIFNSSRNPSNPSVKLDFLSPQKSKMLVTGPAFNHQDHPLMRPLSTALPTFTPVLSSENNSNKTSQFLEEVLK